MAERHASARRPRLHETIEVWGKGFPEVKQSGRGAHTMPVSRAALRDPFLQALAELSLARGAAFGTLEASRVASAEQIRDKISELAYSVESMKQELISCKEAIDTLSEELGGRPLIKETKLFDIDEKLDVMQPITIVIEEFRDEVIASLPELEIFAVANNEPEAICNLKVEIRDLYYDLITTPKDQLGRLPLSWLRILERMIRKLGDA